MSTILSVIAIIAALASVVLNLIIYDHNSRAQDAEASKSLPSNTGPAIAIPPPPKTNDKRIVRKSDGKYYIQYFWDIPGWKDMNYNYDSPQEAKRMLEAIAKAPEKPKVVEVVE